MVDGVAVAAVVTASAALAKVFWPSKSHNASHSVSEVVDDSVLGRFEELFERIGTLETDLAEAKRDLAMALVEIRELHKLEEYLQAHLHERTQRCGASEPTKSKTSTRSKPSGRTLQPPNNESHNLSARRRGRYELVEYSRARRLDGRAILHWISPFRRHHRGRF